MILPDISVEIHGGGITITGGGGYQNDGSWTGGHGNGQQQHIKVTTPVKIKIELPTISLHF